MDTEQLELIMKTLSTMGEDGKDAFIWWVILDKALPVVGGLIALFALMSGTLVAIRVYLTFCEMGKKLKNLRDLLGVGRTGYLTESEIDRTLDRAIELAEMQALAKLKSKGE